MTKFKPGDKVIPITGKGAVRTLRDVPAQWAHLAWAQGSDRIWFADNDCWGYAKIYMLAPKSQEIGMGKVLVGQVWKPKAYRGKSIVSTVTVRKVTVSAVHYKWNDSATLTGVRGITQFLDEWELVEATSLPPAPHSVRYYPNSAQPHVHITVEQYKDSTGSFIAVDSAVIGSCVSQYLEPDTALQLAHDLMRMALKLKREQEG